MTRQHRLKLAAVMLLLPLLALGGIILKNERDIASAKTWRVKITGYDPRDLLYGHYLSFRFDWSISPEQGVCAAGESCCLCLDARRESTTPLTSVKSCAAATHCATALSLPNRATCLNGAQSCAKNDASFDPEGAQRYFVPEAAAAQLNTLLASRRYNLSVDFKVAPSGEHVFGDLYIDDVEWRDYLRANPGAGEAEPAQSHPERTWRMKISDARLYGDYLVFELNWGTPPTRRACPDANSCCALCLTERAGSSQPGVQYGNCGARDQCLETLILPNTDRLNHADRGFDPNGPQKYPMSTEEAEQLAPILSGPAKDFSVDVLTRGWGGAPEFGDLYIDGVEWRDWRRRHMESRKPKATPGDVKK